MNYSIETFGEFLGLANTATSGHFWTAILLMLFLVLLVTFLAFMLPEGAILVASFISLLLAIMLRYMDLIPFTYVGIFIGIIIVMVMYIIYSNRLD